MKTFQQKMMVSRTFDTPSFNFILSKDYQFRNQLIHQQLMKGIAGKKSLNERFDKADKSLINHKYSKCD
jgi:hypothetical protein